MASEARERDAATRTGDFKKSTGDRLTTIADRYAAVTRLRELYTVRELCRVLEVSESGYYRQLNRPRSLRAVANDQLLEKIRAIHREHREVVGVPRVHAALRHQGESVGLNRVERLMRRAGLSGLCRGRRRVRTTDSNHGYRVAENLLNREFDATGPNRKWVADITYVSTDEGWLYVATVLDLYSRMIVGWSSSDRIDQQLTLSALEMAVRHRQPTAGLLHHSDRGVQYAATSYRDSLSLLQMRSSMSRKGNCWDNAVVESWHRTLKVECVYRNHYRTRAEGRQSLFDYIEVFYNRKRMHSALGYLSPAEFERRYRMGA